MYYLQDLADKRIGVNINSQKELDAIYNYAKENEISYTGRFIEKCLSKPYKCNCALYISKRKHFENCEIGNIEFSLYRKEDFDSCDYDRVDLKNTFLFHLAERKRNCKFMRSKKE